MYNSDDIEEDGDHLTVKPRDSDETPYIFGMHLVFLENEECELTDEIGIGLSINQLGASKVVGFTRVTNKCKGELTLTSKEQETAQLVRFV